ncbi:MAG: hypothetical protein ACLGG0_06675 [Bacteriovoracia bacterium]
MRFIFFFLIILIASCSTTHDPLQNTKKLAKDGHSSLYHNGAFQIPLTKVKLIPPAPSAWELAQSMAGLKARASFLAALQGIKDSYQLVEVGSIKSWKAAAKIRTGTGEVVEAIHYQGKSFSKLIIEKSLPLPENFLRSSVQLSKEVNEELRIVADKIKVISKSESKTLKSNFYDMATRLSDKMNNSAKKDIFKAWSDATQSLNLTEKRVKRIESKLSTSGDTIAKSLHHSAKENVDLGLNKFVKGYLAIPKNLKSSANNIKDAATTFPDGFTKINQDRSELSENLLIYINEGWREIDDDVRQSLHLPRTDSGSLNILYSLAGVIKILAWDVTVKPITKIGSGALGYVLVNTLAYPAMISFEAGKSVTYLATELTLSSGKLLYDLTAPSISAALAGGLAALQWTAATSTEWLTQGAETTTRFGLYSLELSLRAGKLVSRYPMGTAKFLGAQLTETTLNLSGEILSIGTRASGEIAQATLKYIAVPISSVGIPSLGVTSGVAIAGTGVATGGIASLGSNTIAGGGWVFGQTLAATTGTAGTVASAGLGATVAAYETAKSVTVPPGYIMGSGVVLSYGALVHLGAQSILAVSDAAYLVLSLEGAHWVIYAVSGKLNDGTDLMPGTVLDLEEMKKQGEEFQVVPVGQDELRRVIENVSN